MGIETLILGGLAASSIKGQYDAAKAQKKAVAENVKNAQRAADASTEATNRANQKRPNSAALLSSNQMAAKGGQAGTMLTGATGVNPGSLNLGKTTLLGGGGS